MPRLSFLEPMKAALAPQPPHDGNWLYEVKFDGFRAEAVKDGKRVELWSRNRKRLDARFPDVVAAIAKLPVARCILDGEVCALAQSGHSSFQFLQNQAESAAPIVYYVFDAMVAGDRDLRSLPLTERQKHLGKILAKAKDPIRPSPAFPGTEKVLATMRKAGGEGVIAKQKDSPYETGRRSGAWTKIKFVKAQEFVVVGYTLPQKSRQHFGSLLLGYHEGKRLTFAGRVGTGFNTKTLASIFAQLHRIEVDSPAVEGVRDPSGRWRPRGWKPSETRWVKPKLVAQVQFTEWTSDGLLRHPSFLGLRDDKAARDVVREDAAA